MVILGLAGVPVNRSTDYVVSVVQLTGTLNSWAAIGPLFMEYRTLATGELSTGSSVLNLAQRSGVYKELLESHIEKTFPHHNYVAPLHIHGRWRTRRCVGLKTIEIPASRFIPPPTNDLSFAPSSNIITIDLQAPRTFRFAIQQPFQNPFELHKFKVPKTEPFFKYIKLKNTYFFDLEPSFEEGEGYE